MTTGLDDAPAAVATPVAAFVDAVSSALAERLASISLHGSLAMGCFNVATSDVDLLIVTEGAATTQQLDEIARAATSGGPDVRYELSVVRTADIEPFIHPAPSDLHVGGGRVFTAEPRKRDPDLAAHVVMAIARGRTLAGRPLAELTNGVMVEDFIGSLFEDNAVIRADPHRNPLYAVLNCCRLFRFMLDGQISSKLEGAVWALEVVPEEHRAVVDDALAVYRGARASMASAAPAVAEAVEWMSVRADGIRATRRW